MKIERQFRAFLILSIVGLVVSGLLREIFDLANVAFECLTVAVTGMLLVTGIYLHGIEEGIRLEIEKNKTDAKSV